MEVLEPARLAELVHPGSRVFLGSNAACPHALIDALLAREEALRDLEFAHILTLGPAPWAELERGEGLRVNTFFIGPRVREVVNAGLGDYTPCNLSDVPELFLGGALPLDVALVMVGPPDRYGYCSLGVSVDVVSAAVRAAPLVIAQVNARMPRTHGDAFVHESRIDYFVEAEAPLPELARPAQTEVTRRIGDYVAQLVPDGATLQLGIGKVPDAICAALRGHRRLGIHTEMLSDGVVELFACGAVDNSQKNIHRGEAVTSFALGTRQVYDFVDDNPHVGFHPTEYTNNLLTIAKNRRMVAINSAVQVDLTGQVSADTIGARLYSGIGGHSDFMRGAAKSEGGMPIVALPSTACGGTVSRICAQLYDAAGVVGTRADAHYVVTEYGIATLKGRSLRERALELVQVAHPDFREELLRAARERRLVPDYQKLYPRPVGGIAGVQYERVKLKDGEYVLRPLHPADERRLQEFFYSHTRETIQQRYGYGVNRMTRERAYQLVSVDQAQDLALGVFEVQGPREVIHAVGRYYLDSGGKSAEMAFVVREGKRRVGMGRLLINRMREVARERGLAMLWAYVAPDNLPMVRLFQQAGARVVSSGEASMLKVEITL